MNSAKYFVGWLSIAITLLGAVAMLCMMVQIVTDGLARTIFHAAIPATNELASFYYMVAVTFLPLAYIHGVRGHVIIELFTSWMSKRSLYLMDGLVGLALAAGAAWFAYATGVKAIAMTKSSEFVIGMVILPTWPTRWFVTIALSALALMAFIKAIDELITGFGGRSVETADQQRADFENWMVSKLGLPVESH